MRLEDVRDGMLVQVVRPSPSVKQFTGLVGVVARVNLKWMHPVLVRFSDGTEQHFGEDELEPVEVRA